MYSGADSIEFSRYTPFFHQKIYMYCNLALYYLNQLGINPWVNKQTYLDLNNKAQIIEGAAAAPKVLIVKQKNLNAKAEALFNKMLTYLNLNADDLLVSDPEQSTSLLNTISLRAVLILSTDSEELKTGLTSNCKVLKGLSPDYLLKNPSDKRSIFKVLNSLKALMTPN